MPSKVVQWVADFFGATAKAAIASLVAGGIALMLKNTVAWTHDLPVLLGCGAAFLFAYLAGLTHILLDFTNNYGVRPFWPFWEKWYSWDIVFIVEPMILILLVAGLVLPAFFALINDEIGVRRKGPQGGLAALMALVGVVALWGVRDYEHRRAVNALKARVYDGADPIRASAYPYWLNPFRWSGVVETGNFYATVLIDSSIPEADPEGRMR